MGLVFRAVRESDGEPVAVKLLKVDLLADETFTARFRQEARAAAEVLAPAPAPDPRRRRGRRPPLHRGRVCVGRLARGPARGGPLLDEVVRIAAELGSGSTRSTRTGSSTATSSPRTSSSRGRRRAPDGLRPGEGPGLHAADAARAGDGDARLPRARADQGRAGDARDRPLRVRLHGLRVRDGRGPFADRGIFQVGLAHLQDRRRTRPSARRACRARSATPSPPRSRRNPDEAGVGVGACTVDHGGLRREIGVTAFIARDGALEGQRFELDAAARSAARARTSRSTTTRSPAATPASASPARRSRSRTSARRTGRS